MNFPLAGFSRALVLLMFLLLSFESVVASAEQNYQVPLTQADIDAYVYLMPALAGKAFRDYDGSAMVLKQSGLSKKRAAYVGTKLALAQALVEGFLTSDKMLEDKVPAYLQPSVEELRLVSDNLETIKKAQQSIAATTESGR